MGCKTENKEEHLRRLVHASLEAARVEAVRRLRVAGFALSLPILQRTVTSNAEGTGWQSGQEQVTVGGFFPEQAIVALSDPSPTSGLAVILKDQMKELAEYLDRETDLGTRPSRLLPDSTGADAIIARYLGPLAAHYLKSLPDLGVGDDSLAAQLASELEDLVTLDTITRTWQLAVAGMRPSGTHRYKDVELRPLTPGERGAFLALRPQPRPFRPVPYSDLFVPYSTSQVIPSALISVRTTRPHEEQQYSSGLLNRVMLACFLVGYKLSGTGILAAFDHPMWAGANGYFPPSPVREKLATIDEPITDEEFNAVAKLAYQMPYFDMTETSGHKIVLSRMLRACGASSYEPTFLDFTSALEFTLLQGIDTKIRYRFSLYGALFLRDELDHSETFARLKQLYKIRNTLAHGGALGANDLYTATEEAAELAKAVVRKAIDSGWPDPKALQAMAPEFGYK